MNMCLVSFCFLIAEGSLEFGRMERVRRDTSSSESHGFGNKVAPLALIFDTAMIVCVGECFRERKS